jgi:hypothetical protein
MTIYWMVWVFISLVFFILLAFLIKELHLIRKECGKYFRNCFPYQYMNKEIK